MGTPCKYLKKYMCEGEQINKLQLTERVIEQITVKARQVFEALISILQ